MVRVILRGWNGFGGGEMAWSDIPYFFVSQLCEERIEGLVEERLNK